MLRSLTFLIRNPAATALNRLPPTITPVPIRFSSAFASNSAQTYGFLEAGNDAKSASAEKGIKIRQEDFWKAFRVGLSQKDDWIDPLSLDGEATYSDNGMDGALIWLVCDAHDLASEPAAVEVFTPDGQHVVTTFDLSTLR